MPQAFRADFHYVGGHPNYPKMPASLMSQVLVGDGNLTYQRTGILGGEWKPAFQIPVTQVAQVTRIGESVEVVIRDGEQFFTIEFRATGITRERDARQLFSAINAVRQGSDSASGEDSENERSSGEETPSAAATVLLAVDKMRRLQSGSEAAWALEAGSTSSSA